MSSLKARLEEIMEVMGWTHADLMRVSRQSSSVVSQWLGKTARPIKSISKVEAAEYLEQETGFAALWIAKGLGPKHVDGGSGLKFSVAETQTPYLTTRDVLDAMGRLLTELPTDRREACAEVLAGWARDGGAPHWKEMLSTLFGLQRFVFEQQS